MLLCCLFKYSLYQIISCGTSRSQNARSQTEYNNITYVFSTRATGKAVIPVVYLYERLQQWRPTVESG